MTGGPACPNVLTKIGSACRQRSGDEVGLMERAPRKAPTESTAHHWSPEPRATVDDENVTILAASANMRPAGDGAEQRMLWMGNIQAHWTNAFVRSLFLVGGPEGVGGVEVSIRRNAFRVSPDTPSVGFALVTFATREAASEALARLQDTPVPGAEGHARFLLRKHAATLTTTTETPGTVRDGVSAFAAGAPERRRTSPEARAARCAVAAPSASAKCARRAGTARCACGFCAGCAPRTARFQNLRNRAPRASRFERAPSRTRRPRRGLSPRCRRRVPPHAARHGVAARLGPSRRRRGRIHLALVAPGRQRAAAAAERQVQMRLGRRARCWRASPGRTRRRWSTASR